ncbi:hypothetical protein DAPPUDRAFT_96224 [Daphnia pulex]|uniref:Uncharacterized protein n=1 Tax=Daphnia pulex TaxID=6669 RepID=E9FXA2_DAPPU|nr:hypothetical protein DAPPUDRAFT_96224 [Daphnia pulex]|eukprot:EFX88043.1 hypothetical protein DAPPUDRAFT_96224 [Daphnia pulex]
MSAFCFSLLCGGVHRQALCNNNNNNIFLSVTAVGYKPKSQLTGLASDSPPHQLMDKASPNLSTASKSASLPGYNNRGFHGAVYNNPSSQATVTSLYGGGGGGANALSSFVNKNQTDQKSVSKVVATDQQPLAGQKKKKWTGWSGFFRRNSKPSSAQQTAPPVHDDTISSDEETGPAQQHHHQQHQATSHSRLVGSPVASGGCHQAKALTSEEASKKRLFLQHPPRTLSKDRSPVVDSLSPLQSDLSASQTSLSRKERRDAILARAQARRQNNGAISAGGSSSDEQPDNVDVQVHHQHLRAPSPSSYWRCGGHHQSQESLTSNGSASRSAGHAKSRTGRTERYLQRRSRDEDSLRREMQQTTQQQQQQQQQSQSSRHASPSCADWPSTCAQLNPSTSKLPGGGASNQRWLSPVSSSIQGPWGGAPATAAAHHHPETGPSNGVQRVMGESPVTLRKPAYNSHNNSHNNNNSPVVGRAQSALVTHPKLSTPPPPPPRNPLKKSYLLQVQSGDQQQTGQQPGQQLPLHSSSGRPTSFSFGDLSRFGQQQQQQQQQQHQLSPGPSSLHDYQNVDQDGRLIPTSNSHALHLPVTSPVQRRVLNSSPQQRQQPGSPSGRHHSAFFPSVSAKSPSPFKSPDQERSKPPPWLASPVSAMKQSAASPCAPPVREFWRSKEVQQQKQTPTSTKSARERLAPFHLTGNNGSVSSLNSDLSSPRSRDPGAQHHNNSNSSNNAVAISPAGVDCPPFYMATTTGSALNSVNGAAAAAGTPRNRFPPVSNDHNNTNNNQQQQPPHHHVRELSQLKPSTDRHLEQAICELEQIYRSLKLDGDEDLLDRAERRDLPTVHQQLAQLPYSSVSAASVCSGSESGGDPLGGHGITSDLDTMMNWSISGSFENLGSASTTTTSANNTEPQRVRAPPNRRSAVPDKVADDMAVRRLAAAARKSQCNDPQAIAAQSGSYLLLSPSLTAAMATDSPDLDGSGCSRSGSFSPDEPDVIYDDVAYRQIRQANKSLRVAEPQPPFGIPLGPVTPASPSDYLHSSVTPEQMDLRPLLHPTKYPDLVRDDLAFRNLRKDAGQLQLPPGPVNTDKLDDLLLQYVPQQSATKSLKKKRAIRSLSANIGQLIRMDAARPSGGGGVVDFNRANDDREEEEDERYIGFNPFDSRAQSLSDLLDESAGYPTNNNTYNSNNNSNQLGKCAKTPRAVKQRSGLKRVGKSVEPDDVDAIIQRQVRPMASWVERAHLSDVPASSTETITNVTERVPALAKLYPTSALATTRKSEVVAPVQQQQQQQPPDLEMDHLICELSECSVAAPPATAPAAPGAGRRRQVDSSGLQLALKPPTGAGSFSSEVPGASSTSPAASLHCWEESPLFQSTPQFHFTQQQQQQQQQRSASPANSSDSGQVSCCAREVRQILHHQIRQEEKERERLASMASSSSGEGTGSEPAGSIQRPDPTTPLHPHAACRSSPAVRLPPVQVASDDTVCKLHETIVTSTSVAYTGHVETAITTTTTTTMSPSPIVVQQTVDWVLPNEPGSDDGIDSLPARSSSRSSPEMEEWSNSSRLSSTSSSSSSSGHDEEDRENEVVVAGPIPVEQGQLSVCQSAARWLSMSDGQGQGKMSAPAHHSWGWLGGGGGDGDGRGAAAETAPTTTTTAQHIIVMHQVVCAGCILTSLLTLCGLDLTTCAQLLLALLALAAVFCDMH